MKKPNLNTIFLIVAALFVAGGLYWYFLMGAPEEQSLSAGAVQSQAQARFETLIGQLEPITFDLTILSDPRFTALVDLTTPLSPESAGRTDPFAPITGVSAK